MKAGFYFVIIKVTNEEQAAMAYNDFFYLVMVILGGSLIIFICNRIYRKFTNEKREERTKVMTLEKLSKEKLFFEIKGKGKFSIERSTKISYLFLKVITINKGTDTIIIRDIEVIMNNRVGKLTEEKPIRKLYHSKGSRSFVIGDEMAFPLELTPNTPNNVLLPFMFYATSVIVGKFDIKLYTSHGELVFPVTVEIER
jgi:hypothetical protein